MVITVLFFAFVSPFFFRVLLSMSVVCILEVVVDLFQPAISDDLRTLKRENI